MTDFKLVSTLARPTGANERSVSKENVVLGGDVEGLADGNTATECASERVVQNQNETGPAEDPTFAP